MESLRSVANYITTSPDKALMTISLVVLVGTILTWLGDSIGTIANEEASSEAYDGRLVIYAILGGSGFILVVISSIWTETMDQEREKEADNKSFRKFHQSCDQQKNDEGYARARLSKPDDPPSYAEAIRN